MPILDACIHIFDASIHIFDVSIHIYIHVYIDIKNAGIITGVLQQLWL